MLPVATFTYYQQVNPTANSTIPYTVTANIWVMATTSNLSAVLTAGFLSPLQLQGHQFTNQDQIHIAYSGGFGLFSCAVSGSNVVTLSLVPATPNIKAEQVSWAGGGTTHAVTITGVTTSSVFHAQLVSTTNVETITLVVATANTITVTFSGDPGAVVYNLIGAIAPQ